MRRIVLLVVSLLALAGLCVAASIPEAAGASAVTDCVDSHALPVPGVVRESDPADVPLDSRVIVSPTSFEFGEAAEPGDRFLCVITLRNRYPRTATLLLEPMGLVGSRSARSTAQFVEPADPDAASTAARWLKPRPARITLQPREVARVPVVVTIPEDAPIGAAYGTIDVFSKSTAPAGETVLGIESRVAVPFLFDIGGEGRPELQLDEVRAPKLRWNRDPWTLRANLDNDGTLHATPRGRVRLRSIFGNTVHQLPIAGTTLLPGGRQRIVETWDDVPWFGFYRYDVRVAPAGEDHADEVTRANGWFLALPPWWVLALAAAVVLLAAAGVVRRRNEGPHPADENDDQADEFG